MLSRLKYILFVSLFIASFLSIEVNANDREELSGKSFTIGWYFWKTSQDHFYLAQGRKTNIHIWQFMTDSKEWIPVHNSKFRDYPEAGVIFDSVSIDANGKTISIGDNIGISEHELANKYFDIQWYFWKTPNNHFYLAQGRDTDTHIWQFMTKSKEWIPMHKAVFKNYPEAGEVFEYARIDMNAQSIHIGLFKNIVSDIPQPSVKNGDLQPPKPPSL